MSLSEFFEEDIESVKIDQKLESSTISSKKISFSQYAIWQNCPFCWKLSYIDKMKKYEDSIHTIFGTAMHEVIQHYINLLYTEGAPTADDYDYLTDFSQKLNKLYADSKEKGKHDKTLTDQSLVEFLNDGEQILKWITLPSNRMKYFRSRAYSVVGIEVPLEIAINGNLKYVGYLDIVLKDKVSGNIKILDIKTSTYGWKDYAKKDLKKTDQLLLYKKFYSELFKVELDNIEIEFIILKRKLIEGYDYNQSRVSIFEPANGKTSIKKVSDRFQSFVDDCFTLDGKHIIDKNYRKNPGDNKKNCKYCDFYKTQHCDSKE